MCGFFGILDHSRQSVSLSDPAAERMLNSLAMRGPDDAGLVRERNFLLGHRRLAIRDLSEGVQPWRAADGSHVLVYNGELYNDDELRAELRARGHHFRTGCDTETVSVAIREWGPDALSRMNGMFALGVVEPARERVWLARDRVGIKPLFVARIGTQILFASRIATLLLHPDIGNEINVVAVSHYLATLRLTVGRDTLYRSIQRVLPGEWIEYSSDSVTHHRYWDFPPPRKENRTDDQIAEEIAPLLADSVNRRLVSDVPVGMFLSGGVDSCTLAALLQFSTAFGMRAVCGSGPDPDDEEQRFARECADSIGFDFSSVNLSAAEYRERWRGLIREYRTPLATPSDPIIQAIAERFRTPDDSGSVVGVALGGEGADELFGGYERQFGSLLGGVAKTDPLEHYFHDNSLIPFAAQNVLFRSKWLPEIQNGDSVFAHYRESIANWSDLPPEEQTVRLLHRVNLESLLERLDSATMSVGLETRVPYTDHRLIDKVMPLPLNRKVHIASDGTVTGKPLLRKLAAALLPDRLANRPKASFPTPVFGWLQSDYFEEIQHLIRTSELLTDLFEITILDELLENPHQAGMWLWPLANLAIWYQK